MANHKSAIKRIKSDASKNMQNKYVHKTTRNAIKKFKTSNKTITFFKKALQVISKNI